MLALVRAAAVVGAAATAHSPAFLLACWPSCLCVFALCSPSMLSVVLTSTCETLISILKVEFTLTFVFGFEDTCKKT